MEQVLSGKPIAIAVNKVSKKLIAEVGLKPKMLLIQVGADPASSYYVQSIISTAVKLGCEAELVSMPASSLECELLAILNKANNDPSIHGIMIQKPLPPHISETTVNLSMNPDKDLDALHPINLGKIMMETDGFLPCTPAAVYYTMKYYGIDPVGKRLVILGRSNVVGKPLANMMLWKKPFANATVTICHSRTKDLAQICAEADILISAIGIANFVKPEMVKPDAILLDVGINEVLDENGQAIYVGDIDYNACQNKALAITPVPGGIGRITTSILYLNLVKACLFASGSNKSVDEYIDLIFSENHE